MRAEATTLLEALRQYLSGMETPFPADHERGPSRTLPCHYSTFSVVAGERRFYLDLSGVAGLLGFDCAMIGCDWNAITLRRTGGRPGAGGIVWLTEVYRRPDEWARAVVALAPPER